MLKKFPQSHDHNISGITKSWKNSECTLLSRPGMVSQWALSSFPPPDWATVSVQYVQYCLAAAWLPTGASCIFGLATGSWTHRTLSELSFPLNIWFGLVHAMSCQTCKLPSEVIYPWIRNNPHAVVRECLSSTINLVGCLLAKPKYQKASFSLKNVSAMDDICISKSI